MLDEHDDYYHAISKNVLVNPPLAHELSQRWIFRDRINTRVASRLVAASRLSGFSGTVVAGERVGRAARGRDVPLLTWAHLEHMDETAVTDDSEQTEGFSSVHGLTSKQEADNLVEFLDNLGLATDGD